MTDTILVSSCLLGLPTRYDGSDNLVQAVVDYLTENGYTPVPVCPEQLAGLPTPRPKCWFTQGDGAAVLKGQGRIYDENEKEVTDLFIRGALSSYQIAQLADCSSAILKQRSPSCGCGKIHQNGQIITGLGVTAALLQQKGLKILSEEDLEQK